MAVYLTSPAGVATGGTELLHQFAAAMSDNGVECYMIYPDRKKDVDPVPERFKKYNVKVAPNYPDKEDSFLVLAETQVHFARECVKGRLMIWWLSVDFYRMAYESEIKERGIDAFNLKEKTNVIHRVQSFYAGEFLKNEMGIEEYDFLGDYIGDEIIDFALKYSHQVEKKNYCIYNPKKGYEYIKPLMDACKKEITWVPLQNLTPFEMAGLMSLSKVYVDFGMHPGMDRIPREAAACRALVLTNKKGSAANDIDVPIPDRFKIEDYQNVEGVLEVIYEMLDDYENLKQLYEPYREIIFGQKEKFIEDVKKLVETIMI
ncbi:MAG: hypothetical protein K6F84_03180 [Lachnospiraceae bacterium]|nr:hypothetical protein [Lachnospiraceae bacterium]